MQLRRLAPIAALCAAFIVAAAGCGGGTDSSSGSGPGLGLGNGSPSLVSRATEGQYSRDALILAARVSPTAFITTETAATVDSDLSRIRAQYPQLSGIRPKETPSLRTVVLGLAPAAPWRAAWRSGNLASGDAPLDALLTKYKLASVRHITDNGARDFYALDFEGPLNTPKVAEEVLGLGGVILSAEENARVGDGNDITLSSSGATRSYAFSAGWGDCAAGCINRHVWNVSVAADGALSLTESGSDLSTRPAPGGSTPQ